MTAGPRPSPPPDGGELARRAGALDWLLFDVDGVFTDGRLVYSPRGEELKCFHVRDGLAVKLARRSGLKVGLLSGRRSCALERRAADLGCDAVMLGSADKAPVFAAFLAEHATAAVRVAYTGDDLPDLPILAACGLSFCPADADPEVRRRVDRVLAASGGAGAVREVVETVLKARGDWDGRIAAWAAAGVALAAGSAGGTG